MEGYCAVCLRDMNKWVKGTTTYQVVYNGKTYLFSGTKQKALFEADPARYIPALGGDCPVCFASGARSPGSIRHGVNYRGRFYFFPNAQHKKKFKADPAKYINADLALGGECPVCRVEMKQRVPGKPEFTAIYGGLRYQFPAEKQREMFFANPQKYDLKD
jgi:YHS domain-containing protein